MRLDCAVDFFLFNQQSSLNAPLLVIIETKELTNKKQQHIDTLLKKSPPGIVLHCIIVQIL